MATIIKTTGRSRALEWLHDHVAYRGTDCLEWPWSCDTHGYAQVGTGHGGVTKAYRLICEWAHGDAPSSKHQAAHSCGNGKAGCVNPRHLSWKTQSENHLDCRAHGTQARNRWGSRGKLKPQQVAQIKAMKGEKTQLQLSKMFGVSTGTIYDIHSGRTHAATAHSAEQQRT